MRTPHTNPNRLSSWLPTHSGGTIHSASGRGRWAHRIIGCALLLALRFADVGWTAPPTFASHPPMHPLPAAANRPLASGTARYVDPKGDDRQEGSKERPWKTLAYAVKQLHAGDVLYLRGGTYYETVIVHASGTAEKPTTIRAYPGELAIIDAGFREFYESPATVSAGRRGRVSLHEIVSRGWGIRKFRRLDGSVPSLHQLLRSAVDE